MQYSILYFKDSRKKQPRKPIYPHHVHIWYIYAEVKYIFFSTLTIAITRLKMGKNLLKTQAFRSFV